MTREVPEWIGKTPDTPAPPRVRQRVFDRHNGICYLSGRKIMPGNKWQLEHPLALINGGENRESNLAPALVEPHKVKTAEDVKQKAKNDRVRKRHLGIKKPRTIRAWRKFNGEIVHAERER
jgi:5-methylcytosine-specific restriction endonuclease McrA